MEEATTQALSGSLFLLVTASQFCVAPAGQTKLRSGGLREGWLTHVGGCAPCCRPRTRPWRRRFAISLAQVVLAFRCGGSRELLTNSDELEGLLIQAASAQTAGPIKYATKAVRPGVLLVCASAFGSADCGLCPGRAAANERGGSSQNRKQMCSANGKRTGKHPCARQDLARRVQEVAIKQLKTAQQAVTTAQEVVGRLTTLWLAERPSGSEKANLLKQELNEAQQNYGMAQQKYAEAQQKYEEAQQNCKAASASIQAGRVQAGASACGVVAVDFGLQHSRVRFRAVHRLCHALLSARVISSLSFTVLACSPSGSGRGSWLLQAQSTGCPLCFADASERGVSPRLEEGGCQPVFRSL